MDVALLAKVEDARNAALEVLRHNARGRHGLPRAAGWGYPEPYTRDLMIASLGVAVSGDRDLIEQTGRVLSALAKNQTKRGHVPSLADEPGNRGASDTTPLFLLGLAVYRRATGERRFLAEAARKALTWMEYQSPADNVMVAQEPTSDWRDEMWVPGLALFVNAVLYAALRLFGRKARAEELRDLLNHVTITGAEPHAHVHEGLVLRRKPYYAFWSRKQDSSERFDLLGNSIAILGGVATRARARRIIAWVETETRALRRCGELALPVAPNLFPYIRPKDPDWRPRYAEYNNPGDYHNGGIWPFVSGFHVAAMVAAGTRRLAERSLSALTDLVRRSRREKGRKRLAYGFNEWFRAQDGAPQGENWQTWSAAMYLYAAHCVLTGRTPFFEESRGRGW